MRHWISTTALTAALCSASMGLHAASWSDQLRTQRPSTSDSAPSSASAASGSAALGGLLGGTSSTPLLSALAVPAASSASNAAGVITYCIQNNYIAANKAKAEQMKNDLLGKVGLQKKEAPKDSGYLSGLTGKITGSNGQSFNLDQLKRDLKEKACDLVLDSAQSLL